MPKIVKECNSCKRVYKLVSQGKIEGGCDCCCDEKLSIDPELVDFSKCPFCECVHFYKQKNFNQALGCLIIFVGAVLVPFTYGMSLLVLAFVDWLLYKRTEDIAVCYKCRTEFIHFPKQSHDMKTFDHHTAEIYETSSGP